MKDIVIFCLGIVVFLFCSWLSSEFVKVQKELTTCQIASATY